MLINMEYKLLLCAILLSTHSAIADDQYENSDELCSKRCSCERSVNNDTLSINCFNKTMQHTIANWPPHTKNLVASFSYNQMTTLEKMPPSNADSIKLMFDHCGIQYIEPGLCSNILNIKFLDLSYNQLSNDQLTADIFKGPYNQTQYAPVALEYLNLAYNKIHSLRPDFFQHTPNLKILNLEGNSMRIVDRVTCMAFSSLRQMQRLNLANNKLTEVPMDVLKQLENLVDINLSYNDLDFVPASLAFVSKTLQKLNVSYNPIIQLTHETFVGMSEILEIYARNLSELRLVRANSFTPLKKLHKLELSHNGQLEVIDDNAFSEVNQLKELYLSDNSLERLSQNLINWSKLEILDISGNQLMCDCQIYNISTQVLEIVKKDQTEPYCYDPRTSQYLKIYDLDQSACIAWTGGRRSVQMRKNMQAMRITLTVLVVVLLTSSALAMWLGYTKWQTYKRSLLYPFPNQVIYNPVATGDFRI